MIPHNIDMLAGLEMGGIPISTIISHYSKIDTLFIRKKSKEYGTCKYYEGGTLNSKRLLIIEDVVTSGGAIIEAVEKLRKDGANISDALCIIDRESGGKENLSNYNINLISLFTKSELEGSIN